jgi:flagellar protein FlgJ
MFVRSFLCAILGVLGLVLTQSQLVNASEDFLARAVPLAQKSQRETSVPASVTLAQAMWETGRGGHSIGDANNYFGIKAGSNIGPIASGYVWAWTKEWNGKGYIETRERFRKYNSMEDSFRDHGLLLATTPRYADAMRAVDDPREFARRIAAAGYATSPTYAHDLIRMMDTENLYQYDLPRNNFELIGQSEALEVNAGDIFQIYFDAKNTGFGTWSPTADYYLASDGVSLFGATARQELDQLVPPDRVKRWALTMIAPADEGTFTTTWRFKHGAREFGPPLTVQVSVRASASPQQWVSVVGVGIVAGLLGLGAMLLGRTKKKR